MKVSLKRPLSFSDGYTWYWEVHRLICFITKILQLRPVKPGWFHGLNICTTITYLGIHITSKNCFVVQLTFNVCSRHVWDIKDEKIYFNVLWFFSSKWGSLTMSFRVWLFFPLLVLTLGKDCSDNRKFLWCKKRTEFLHFLFVVIC